MAELDLTAFNDRQLVGAADLNRLVNNDEYLAGAIPETILEFSNTQTFSSNIQIEAGVINIYDEIDNVFGEAGTDGFTGSRVLDFTVNFNQTFADTPIVTAQYFTSDETRRDCTVTLVSKSGNSAKADPDGFRAYVIHPVGFPTSTSVQDVYKLNYIAIGLRSSAGG